MGLNMRGMILGCGARAQKHHTEKLPQSSHLVNPPEFEFMVLGVREK